MRKIMTIVLHILLLLIVIGCDNPMSDVQSATDEETGEDRPSNDEMDVEVIFEDETISLSNGYASYKFNKINGSLVSLYNKKTNSESIGNFGGNFTMYVDTSTEDMWSSKPMVLTQCQPDGYVHNVNSYPKLNDDLVMLSSRDYEVYRTDVVDIEGGKKIVFYYSLDFQHKDNDYYGIEVICSVELLETSKETIWNYEIINNCSNTVITQFVAAQIEDILANNEYSLFWPMHEGEIHKDAVELAKTSKLVTSIDGFASDGTKNLVEEYPSHLSMSLIQLFNEKQSIFYYVTDENYEYKQFNFGIYNDQNYYDEGNNLVSLSSTHYPFIEGNGSNKKIASIHLGLGNEGSWYEGSDLYREWLLSQNPRSLSYMDSAKNLPGFGAATMKMINNSKPSIGYVTMYGNGNIKTTCESFNAIGANDVFFLGWMDEGFDSKYPDYNLNSNMGNKDDLKLGIEQAHLNNDKVVMYINLYAATSDSKWFNRKIGDDLQGDLAKVVSAYEKDYRYVFPANGTNTAFISICPGSQYFVNAIEQAVQTVAEAGADGIFFDQMMEMSATLCFNKSHGHSTPATAYKEGYDKLFVYINSVMSTYSDDYYFSCEGICDAYIQYVDIPGLMWSRLFGYSEYNAPEITRYTIPTRIMGLPNAATGSGTKNQYSRSFVYGNPLRLAENNSEYAKDILTLYKDNIDVYSSGRYIDKRYLDLNVDEDVVYGGIIKDNTLIVTIYNNKNIDINNCILKINIPGKKVISVSDIFTGNSTSYQGFMIKKQDVKSFKILLEEEK